MIIKHVPMKAAKKSSYVALVKYLTGPQGKDERVGVVRISNCLTLDAHTAALEILNTQQQNTRSQADKTYHLIVSFRTGEAPETEILKAIEAQICEGLGLGAHQRISVVHHDTDNLHLHIAINKIHPGRLTIHEPFNAYHTFAKLCERLENTFGLQKDNHQPGKQGGENRAADMEQHAAVESLLGWVKRECTQQIRDAGTWQQLHQALAEHGLHIRERGNGFVISSGDGVAVKASSVAREFSRVKLEQRLGGFVPSPASSPERPAHQRYSKRPMASNLDTTTLYAQYKHDQHSAMTAKADEWKRALARQRRLIEAAKRSGRFKRAAIKLVRASRVAKKLMYAATSKALRNEISDINQHYAQERKKIHDRYWRLAWADWLRQEASAGSEDALQALRSRKKPAQHSADTLQGDGQRSGLFAGARHDSVTKKGTVIYRFGASVVRDNGTRLDVARGADQAALQAALLLAMARYGNCITVQGSDDFKEHIARAAAAAHLSVRFDDAALERRRQLLAQSLTKGNHHENHNRHDHARSAKPTGRPGGSSHGSREAAAASQAAAASRAAEQRPVQRQHEQREQRPAHRTQPHAGNTGATPPAAARHRLRGMSELGVVHVAERGEMLLPGDVPDHLGHAGAQPDHGVRRDVHRPGGRSTHVKRPAHHTGGKPKVAAAGTAPPPASKDRLASLSRLGRLAVERQSAVTTPVQDAITTAGQAPSTMKKSTVQPDRGALRAAEKYVIEREQKRVNGFDIPKHKLYTFSQDTAAGFAGLRHVDGQALALLAVDGGIEVLPVDAATMQRLKRLQRGQVIAVSAQGAVKTKGRSR